MLTTRPLKLLQTDCTLCSSVLVSGFTVGGSEKLFESSRTCSKLYMTGLVFKVWHMVCEKFEYYLNRKT
jgi:hypothetical protein